MFHVREFIEPVAAPRRSSVFRFATWLARVAAARRDLAQLAGMSDHELADIGLNRQDLRDATAMRLGDDPTRMFATRARERRRARSAVNRYAK
jgi:uncharacterized protein YjiS (DUF1127 family)